MTNNIPIPVLLDPTYGISQPITNQIERIFTEHGKKWRVKLVFRSGDALRHARKAVQSGVEMVVCFGDDQLLLEVIRAVYGSQIPIGYIPDTPDSVFAQYLRFPHNSEQLIEQIGIGNNIREVNVGLVNGNLFMMNIMIGPHETLSEGLKKNPVWNNISLNSMVLQENLLPTRYQIKTQDDTFQFESEFCIISHIFPLAHIHPDMDSLDTLDNMLKGVFFSQTQQTTVIQEPQAIKLDWGQIYAYHWSAQEITVQAEPSQLAWCDGASIGQTPVQAKIGVETVHFITC